MTNDDLKTFGEVNLTGWPADQPPIEDPRVNCCPHESHHKSVETTLQPCAECQHLPDPMAPFNRWLKSCGFDVKERPF